MEEIDRELIEKYLINSKTARMMKAKDKSSRVLISSLKISEITGINITMIEDMLNSCKLVKFSFVNSGMKIYEII